MSKQTRTTVSGTIFLIFYHGHLETLFEKLQEFETTGIDFYSNSNPKKRVVTHPSGEHEKIVESVASEMGNPYKLI